jgi:hypothetical protein
MKKYLYLVVCMPSVFLVGCETRSISNSGYNAPYAWNGGGSMDHRELSEFDILAAPAGEATQGEIFEALKHAFTPKIKKGDKLLLIQSGAMVPDNEMMECATNYFSVAPFSGVPPAERSNMGQSLRLRAARGGYHYILCYWGVLESAQEDREGKVVSWVPILGSFVPDQREQMRIRLKGIVIDVASANWKMVTPEAHTDARFSSDKLREEQDQKLVMELKTKGYQSLITELLKE